MVLPFARGRSRANDAPPTWVFAVPLIVPRENACPHEGRGGHTGATRGDSDCKASARSAPGKHPLPNKLTDGWRSQHARAGSDSFEKAFRLRYAGAGLLGQQGARSFEAGNGFSSGTFGHLCGFNGTHLLHTTCRYNDGDCYKPKDSGCFLTNHKRTRATALAFARPSPLP